MTQIMTAVSSRGELLVRYKMRSYYFDGGTEPEPGEWIVFDVEAARDLERVTRLPPNAWRRAVLDDVMDESITVEHGAHSFLSSFPSEQILAFYQLHHGDALDRLTAIVRDSPMDGGSTELTNRLDMPNRVTGMPIALAKSVRDEAAAAQLVTERLKLASIEGTSNEERAETLLGFAHEFMSREVLGEAILSLAETLHAMDLPDAELEAWLLRCDFRRSGRAGMHRAYQRETEFWNRVAEFYFFPQNERDCSIDITDAYESTFRPGPEAVEARRIGRLRPGRTYLRLWAGSSEPMVCIAGTRRLKMDVAANGGELRRMGVTLTIGRTKDESLNELLVEVEQLELLASLNPAQAVRRVPRILLPNDPIAIAAERAHKDHRWGRILADLLIEELFSIDADVIRRQIRSARVF